MEKNKSHETGFQYTRTSQRLEKPRLTGLTEVRGPYYSVMGTNYLKDVLSTMSRYIDSVKFAGGSFSLFPKDELKRIIDLCHSYDVEVSTGGFIEHVLTLGQDAVDKYINECRAVGFDILEISAGFITLPLEDWLRLVERVQKTGLKAKPEVGIQFGAGGGTEESELKAEGVQDPDWAIAKIKKFIDAGAFLIMIESEGITENVHPWRTDVPAKIIHEVGLEKVMFEAADPDVFGWYIKNYGPDVNLFVDHSQIVQLECLRAGIWGTKDVWGRVVTYKDSRPPTQAHTRRSNGKEKLDLTHGLIKKQGSRNRRHLVESADQ